MKNLIAQDVKEIHNPLLSETIRDFSGTKFFSDLLPRLIGLAFVVGVLIFVFIIILGAIQWIISGGDKAGIEAARGKITNAIVGIIILFCLFAILKIVGDFFGINILELNLDPLIQRVG
jgi:hypothetical protein